MAFQKITLFAFLSVLVFSCTNKDETLIFESPEKEMSVIVRGTQKVVADPYMVDLQLVVDGDTIEQKITTEVYLPEMSKEYVTVEWRGKYDALIGLNKSDGMQRTFVAGKSGNQIFIQEAESR